MKYWLLTSEYPPAYGGGIGTYALHSAHMFASGGHEVTVVVKDEMLESEIVTAENEGVRVVRFRPGRTEVSRFLGREARWSYDLAVTIAEMISQDGPPDLVECQEYAGLPYFLLQRRWTLDPVFRSIPVLLTLHTPQYVCDLYNQSSLYSLPVYWLGEMERFCLRAADGIISPSQYLLEEVGRTIDLDNQKPTVVPYPFRIMPNRPKANHDDTTATSGILFIGRLERRKGILELLSHMAGLWKLGYGQSLTLLGGDFFDYPANDWMRAVIGEKFKPYIKSGLLRLHDPVPPMQLHAMMEQARLVVVPSIFENFPFVILETMASGTPVLCSTSGGQAEIVQDGISGFTFSHTAAGEFEEKLRQAMDLNIDERKSIAEAARDRVQQKCAYESVYPQKLEVMERLTARKADNHLFPFIRGSQRRHAAVQAQKNNVTLLSVVIPFYNSGRYLEDTLKSLAKVRGVDLEVIVVDDGSDELESLMMLEELQRNHGFSLLKKENGGLASARNAGALEAKGDFLAFLDADDTVEPEYYPRAIDIFHAYSNVSFVGCWSSYWGGSQGIWPAWNPEPPFLLVHNQVVGGALVFRRRDFIEFGLNDPAFEFGLEDYESTIGMVENGCRGVVIPEGYLNYRVHPGSLMRQFNPHKEIITYQWIVEKHQAIYREYGAEVTMLLNANGPGYLYDNPTEYLPQVGFLSEKEPGRVISEDEQRNEIPNLSALTFFYFGIRKALFPLYLRLGGGNHEGLQKLKGRIKSLFIRPGDGAEHG